ncbi:MAG: hypothetical protein V3T49_04905 [Dehalococcoidia bacterium]
MSVDRYIQRVLNEDSGENAVRLTPDTELESELNRLYGPRPTSPVQLDTISPTSAATREPEALSDSTGANSPFDALWRRIQESAGEAISTKRGRNFTYEVESGYLTVHESGARIPRSQFKKALVQWPQNGPSDMRGIYAAYVVWAVLADDRILPKAA